MGQLIDLTGKRFERWLVIKYAYHNPDIFWLCKCDCGVERAVNGSILRKNQSKSCGCYAKELQKLKVGEKHHNWKGKNISVGQLHTRMYKRVKNRGICKLCKKKSKTDLANKSQKYKHDIRDWMWLCRKCHRKYDNMPNRLWKTRKANKKGTIIKIKKDWEKGLTTKDLMEKYGLVQSTIWRITHNLVWN